MMQATIYGVLISSTRIALWPTPMVGNNDIYMYTLQKAFTGMANHLYSLDTLCADTIHPSIHILCLKHTTRLAMSKGSAWE